MLLPGDAAEDTGPIRPHFGITSPGERVRQGRTGKVSFMQRTFGILLILIGVLCLMMTFGLIR